MRPKTTFDDGLFYALLAMSFFRGRHQGRKKYQQARIGSWRDKEMVDCFINCVRDARRNIALARQAGFRGSVRMALMSGENRTKRIERTNKVRGP